MLSQDRKPPFDDISSCLVIETIRHTVNRKYNNPFSKIITGYQNEITNNIFSVSWHNLQIALSCEIRHNKIHLIRYVNTCLNDTLINVIMQYICNLMLLYEDIWFSKSGIFRTSFSLSCNLLTVSWETLFSLKEHDTN